jgi:ribonuclease J
MIRKNRMSFSSVSIENQKVHKPIRHSRVDEAIVQAGAIAHTSHPISVRQTSNVAQGHKAPERKKIMKSSTYQYSTFKKGSRAGGRPFENRNLDKKTEEIKVPPVEKDVIRIIPLGGVEEVGRNMILVESENDIIVLDMGFHFVEEEETMGADYTLPNFKYLEEKKDKIRAVAITHGHLDHIGGIPFIMDRIGNPPIYAQYLTTLMIKKRQEEYVGKPPLKINVVDANSKIQFNQLSLEFFPVYHSIPDSMGVVVGTPYGKIVVSGDMKVEHEAGKPTHHEETKWKALGEKGVLLLVADSTSSELPGFSIEEKEVQKNIERIIGTAHGRLIIGTFASQFERMIKIVEICEKYNKKVVMEGRSIKSNIEIAKLANLLKTKEDTIIDVQEIENYPPDRIVIIATGAQGEEFAALMRIATNKDKFIRFHDTDTVMLSSSVIPGNETNVQKLKDNLYRHNLKLLHYGIAEVHSGGHARQEDLVWINKMVNPKFFMPGYGNHSMLRIHAQVIQERNNFPKENTVVPDNGMVIEISDKGKKISVRKEKAPSNTMVVDGLTVGDTQRVVIKDRLLLAQDGMFVVVVLIDPRTGKLKKSPDLISRGFVYLKENQELLRQVRIMIKKSVESLTDRGPIDLDYIKSDLGESVAKYLYQKTAKKPLVIPVILNV